jgi:hypothetical protein
VTLKRVRFWSNGCIIGGAFLFCVVAGVGATAMGAPDRFAHSWWALTLLAPVAIMLSSCVLVLRYWRCAECGALLPAINYWHTRRMWHCLKCGAPFDLR